MICDAMLLLPLRDAVDAITTMLRHDYFHKDYRHFTFSLPRC